MRGLCIFPFTNESRFGDILNGARACAHDAHAQHTRVLAARVMEENEHAKGRTLSTIIDDLSLFSPLSEEFDSRPVVRRV